MGRKYFQNRRKNVIRSDVIKISKTKVIRRKVTERSSGQNFKKEEETVRKQQSLPLETEDFIEYILKIIETL